MSLVLCFSQIMVTMFVCMHMCINVPVYICIFELQSLADIQGLMAEIQALEGVRGLVITADNVRQYASYIHSSVTIRDRLIHVSSGNPDVAFLKFNLGKLRPDTTIKVTVALKPGPANVDSDPIIELNDGTKFNRFSLLDPTLWRHYSPCLARRASQDNTLVPAGTKQGSIYQMIFGPDKGYGACTAGYENGYINSARFTDKLDLSKEISVVMRKDDDPPEEYNFHYFIIEVL